MEKSETGMWQFWEYLNEDSIKVGGYPDSIYCTKTGFPDNGDLIVPDLELKMKSLWYGDSLYFLLRRLDDSLVNGLNSDGTPDSDVADGISNVDATTLYFYFSNSSYRKDNNIESPNDSVAWLSFVWNDQVNDTNIMMARLPGSGDTVYTYDEFSTKFVQWYEEPYYYVKLAINMVNLAPYYSTLIFNSDSLNSSDTNYFFSCGFELETTENDKEGIAPFELQTRAYLRTNLGENPLSRISDWSELRILQAPDSVLYISSIKALRNNLIASVYPVPANDYVTIYLAEQGKTNCLLFDLTGRILISRVLHNQTNTLNLTALQPGTYFIRLQNDKGQASTRKILIR